MTGFIRILIAALAVGGLAAPINAQDTATPDGVAGLSTVKVSVQITANGSRRGTASETQLLGEIRLLFAGFQLGIDDSATDELRIDVDLLQVPGTAAYQYVVRTGVYREVIISNATTTVVAATWSLTGYGVEPAASLPRAVRAQVQTHLGRFIIDWMRHRTGTGVGGNPPVVVPPVVVPPVPTVNLDALRTAIERALEQRFQRPSISGLKVDVRWTRFDLVNGQVMFEGTVEFELPIPSIPTIPGIPVPTVPPVRATVTFTGSFNPNDPNSISGTQICINRPSFAGGGQECVRLGDILNIRGR